jgi:hypothetical protein
MKIAFWSIAGILLFAAAYSAAPDLQRHMKMRGM